MGKKVKFMKMNLKVKNLIKQEIRIPTLPAVAAKILQAVNKDDAALSELGEIISVDPALSAKMLRVANSGLFTCHREVTDINRAMSVLGTNTIKCIALSFIISDDLSKQKNTVFSIDDFWRHAVTTAVAAELLSKKLKCQVADLFLIALLQDLGILTALLTKGNDYKNLLDSAADGITDLAIIEREQLGYDHQQIVALLFEQWNLPETMVMPVLFHHNPEEAPEAFRQTAEILQLADRIAEIYAEKISPQNARLVKDSLVTQHGLAEDEAMSLLDEVAEKSREVVSLFDIDPLEMRPYSELLQEANCELERLNLSSAQLILELQESKEQNQRLIEKLQDANSRLKEMVYLDGLTGVHNHRFFQEALDRELARASRYRSSISLVLFDIDDFKLVNDNYGHLVGDMVLMNLARAVTGAVRTTDLVARFGGDEFAIILPSTNSAGTKTFAEHLRSCVEGIATKVEGTWITTTISVGAATATPSDGAITKEQLIEVADSALYQSKKGGRNQVMISEVAAC